MGVYDTHQLSGLCSDLRLEDTQVSEEGSATLQAFCTTDNATHTHQGSSLSLEGGGATTELSVSAKSHVRLFNIQMLSSPDLCPAYQGNQLVPKTFPRNDISHQTQP